MTIALNVRGKQRPPLTLMGRPVVEHKTFVLDKAAFADNGDLTGYGAIFHNLDDGGDIIEPGFFADVIPDFLREGFLAWNHDWGTPCAIPTHAVEDAKGLAISAAFHSDPESQRYRTIAAERLAAGKSVGLSIGYEIAPGGATLEKDGRHLRKASRLFEVSLVMVPMNRLAEATDVKTLQKAAADNVATASYILQMVLDLIQSEAADLEPNDPDAAEDEQDISTLGQIRDLIGQYLTSTAAEVGTADDMSDVAAEQADPMDMMYFMGRSKPLADHSALVAKAATSFHARVKNLNRLRVKEGRVLSSSNVERLQGHIDTLSALVSDMKDLLASASVDKGAANPVEIAYLMTEARLAGVQI